MNDVLSARGKAAATTAAFLLLLVPAPATATAGQTAGASSPDIPAGQEIVALLTTHGVRSTSGPSDRVLAYVGARRPITRGRTVLPVLARTTDADGRSWLRVRLPGRALGRKRPPPTGWITAAGTRSARTAWHLVVDLSERRVLAYRGGKRVRSYRAIVGAPSTPTRRGEHFVEENVRLPSGHSGAPYGLATSARSSVLQEFAGGPGQIALHGIRNIGGRLGTAVSHGCVRLSTRSITWLAARIRPGVPVTIVR